MKRATTLHWLVALAIVSTAASALAEDMLKLAIGQRGNWENAAPELGQKAGFFRKHGLTLELLYTQRCNEPEKPTMNLHELEDLLGCPREHLEFSLWYLKENGLVARADNGRFAVTAKGVDWAETEEAAARLREDRLLPASSNPEQNAN